MSERVLTWAALLGRCMEFARAAVALPEGDRWREAVAPICTLMAVTRALEEIDELPDDERAAALDRAEILCRGAVRSLHELWRGEDLPEHVGEVIQDSRVAFDMAANAGVEWLVASERLVCAHPGDLVERLLGMGFAGELFVAAPGVAMFSGAVAAFARGPGGTAPSDEVVREVERFLRRRGGKVGAPERIAMPRQVYRQMDFGTGKVVRDVVVALNETLPGGQPLLVLAIDAGRACLVGPEARGGERQEPVPVVSAHEEGAGLD